ncbi:c-type cytochrome [Rhizomonospora bruguierae]|uniref:c-type cytochrome n=1 Tax=Rhizomonospora bruguierae TaxID=1581705 RepID=UPI001BCF8F3A|nr:c-type cytochrome [Micromonospora sp. NBRC 107566]
MTGKPPGADRPRRAPSRRRVVAAAAGLGLIGLPALAAPAATPPATAGPSTHSAAVVRAAPTTSTTAVQAAPTASVAATPGASVPAPTAPAGASPTAPPGASSGASPNASPGASPGAPASAEASGPPPGLAAANPRGDQLYRQSCASCHGVTGQGSARGPSINAVGAASVDFQLSTGRMPLRDEPYADTHRTPAFSPPDIAAIVRYVAALPPGGGPPIPRVGDGDARSGRELYLTHCAACHSSAGVGATLNNGRVAPSLANSTPTQIGEAIRVGPGLMPAFPEGVLSDGDVDAVASYVQVLRNGRGRLDRGGWSLGRLGPFPEGAVGWLIGMGLIVLLVRRLGSRAG